MTQHLAAMRAALGLFIAGGLCLTTLDAVGKILMSEVGLPLLIWARYLGQVLISVPLSATFAGAQFWRSTKPRLQLFRSFLMLMTSILFFAGIHWLPLAEASAISFTAPIWVALLSGGTCRKDGLVGCGNRLFGNLVDCSARHGDLSLRGATHRNDGDCECYFPALNSKAHPGSSIHDVFL